MTVPKIERGKPVQGTRIVAVVVSIGKDRCKLVVIRPDTDVIGYITTGRTLGIALEKARADGVNVSDVHQMSEWPTWSQRRFFRVFGWQTNWKVLGWALVRQPKKVETEAA